MTFVIIFIVLALAADAATYYFLHWWDVDWSNLFGPDHHIWQAIIWPIGLFFLFFIAEVILWILYVVLKGQILAWRNKPGKTTLWKSFLFAETTFLIRKFLMTNLWIKNRNKIPKVGTPFVLVANHLSSMDPFCFISMFPDRPFACVSKTSNFDLPGAGGWMIHNGYISIVQGDIAGGNDVIRKAGEKLKEGCSIYIAPEGTRNKAFPEPLTLPFHPGSFEMAYIAKAPIVVAAIQNTHVIFKRFPFRFTRVYVDILATWEYEEYKDMTLAEVAEQARLTIENHLVKYAYRTYHKKKKRKK